MKIDFFMLFISLALCGLVFFGFYEGTDCHALYTWVSAVASFFFLTPALALKWPEYPRGTIMTKVFSAAIFAIMLIVNILLAKYEISNTIYIIANGVLFCIWAAICYGITRAKQ